METTHRIVAGDSRSLDQIADDAVELVVTSPPYPMIEMWDDLFTDLNPAIAGSLDDGDGQAAFEAMHTELDEVWAEVERVLVDGGIACVNIGDATRTLADSFRVYQNHSRVIDAFERLGFEPLPEILWRKPVNSAAKFMGSGMVPPNAYVTLEHEYILVFRNGESSRQFEPGADRRYEAAYFWEERNTWFSDVWTEVRGELQHLEHDDLRERSGAYPFEIPYRLINMYSVYGDTVLDPFWGTGTTTIAALAAGRDSIGYEIDDELVDVFRESVDEIPDLSREAVDRRLAAHRDFVDEREEAGDPLGYKAETYDVPVTTKQEQAIRFYAVSSIEETEDGYSATHTPVEGQSTGQDID